MKTALCLLWAVFLTASLALHVSAQDFATQTLNATYKLFNKASTGTCFFIRTTPEATAKNVILVTAGHVLSEMSGDTAIVVLRQPQGNGAYQRRDWSIPTRQDGKPLWTVNPTHDVAVMRVRLPDDAQVTALPLSSLATEKDLLEINLHITSPLSVLGFPTRFESNTAGFPVGRHGSVASFPLTPVALYNTFLADFATFPGDSGGPVFVLDTRQERNAAPLILGLVLAQIRHDEKIQSEDEEQTIHHPLQLATILDAQFIRDAIEQVPK